MRNGARPLHDDQALFELLCMETYQAGLSWETVLNKRQGFRESFHAYQLQRVAEMTDDELEALLDNPAIIRNRSKDLCDTGQCSTAFYKSRKHLVLLMLISGLLSMGKTIVNDVPDYRQAPAKTALSEKLAKDLKSVVLSLQVQSQFCPIYRLQAWLMTMRMIVNGKVDG